MYDAKVQASKLAEALVTSIVPVSRDGRLVTHERFEEASGAKPSSTHALLLMGTAPL